MYAFFIKQSFFWEASSRRAVQRIRPPPGPFHKIPSSFHNEAFISAHRFFRCLIKEAAPRHGFVCDRGFETLNCFISEGRYIHKDPWNWAHDCLSKCQTPITPPQSPVFFIRTKEQRAPMLKPIEILHYRGAEKSLARPGRKKATATEDFDIHISYL
jgi:hypothetical protein